jgi:hypothetical protein
MVNLVNHLGLAAEEETEAGEQEFLGAHGRDFQSEFTGRQRSVAGRRRPSANPGANSLPLTDNKPCAGGPVR